MSIDYWTDGEDPYIDPATKVLRNLLGIGDRRELEIAEDAYSDASILEVFPFIIKEKHITLKTWQTIHGMMFGEVYDWAGKLRTVRMSKGISMFANPQFIDKSAETIFKKLEEDKCLQGFPLEKVADRLSFYYNELNAIHPFREGNGRSLKIIISEIARRAGYMIDWELLSFEDNIAASIEGFSGNYAPFSAVFMKILKPL